MESLIYEFIQYAAGLAVTGLVALIGASVRLALMHISERHRVTLHQALRTGAMAALQRGLQGYELSKHAADYAVKSSPKAVRKTGATPEVMQEIARSKVMRGTC